METRSPWKILVAEVGYFLFVLLAIYAGYLFWNVTMFSKIEGKGIGGTVFSFAMLILIILAMIPTFLLCLRRILLRLDVISKDDSRRFLRSRTWFVTK